MKRLALLLAVPLLAACSVFGAPALPTLAPESLITPTETNTPSPPTNTPLPTNTPTETMTPSPITNTPFVALSANVTELPYQACTWNWATQPLPDLSAQISDEIIAAGQPDVIVKAAAYGENCLASDGSVNHFAAMQTDMEIKVQVEDVSNREQANQAVLMVLTVLKNYPPQTIPGPNSGQVTLKVITGTQQALISKKYDQLMAGLAAYSAGDDLLSDLGVMMNSTLP
jgi:hypothetical protein